MSIYQRSLVVTIFLGAVALGVHSARGQGVSGSAPSSPNGRPPISPAQTMPSTPGMPNGLPQQGSGNSTVPTNVSQPGQSMPSGLPDGLPQALPPGAPPPFPTPTQVQSQMPQGNQALGQPQFGNSNPTASPAPFAPSEVHVYAPSAEGNKTKIAVLRTTMGDITIKLFPVEAPKTVKNFVDLAVGEKDFVDVKTSKKTRRPFYNGLTFHRVVKGFVIQAGCPFGNGRGGPGYSIDDEISPSLKFDRPGIVAMAAARKKDQKGAYQANSNGSQFFITLAPQPDFDGKLTIFGEVIKGMDVVNKISSVKTGPTDRPIKRVFISAIDVPDHKPAATPTPRPLPENLPAQSIPQMPSEAMPGAIPEGLPVDPQDPQAMQNDLMPAGPESMVPAAPAAPH